MIYFAILPHFMDTQHSAAMQAVLLSAIFISLCGVVYAVLSIALAANGKRAGTLDRRRARYVEGISGGLILVAAVKLAST